MLEKLGVVLQQDSVTICPASLEMREENPRLKIYSGIPYLVSFFLKRFHRTACSNLFGKNEFNLHHVEIEITKNEEPMF